MLDDYPEARKFYMERAWQRRTEFRRRQKKFFKNFIREKQKIQGHLNGENFSTNSKNHHEDGEESEEDSQNSDESEKEIDVMLKDRISKKISRFYYNVNITQELESDDDSEDLEEISEDEY